MNYSHLNTLPEEAIYEYQAIYKRIYGKALSIEEATSQANRLFSVFVAIYKPIQTRQNGKNRQHS